jgi:hypothetical protein
MNNTIRALFAFLFVLIAAVFATPTTAYQRVHGATRSMADAVPPWQGAGVYVFGEYVLDITKLAERTMPFVTVGVKDCSTPKYFCASARKADPLFGQFHFVVPRKCVTPAIGDRWNVGDVTTEVLNVLRIPRDPLDLHSNEPEVSYFLGSTAFPDTVYRYTPRRGIIQIYGGLGKNLVAMAKKSANFSEKLNPNYLHYLTTFDPLAACSQKP